jgi:hypothetical protein
MSANRSTTKAHLIGGILEKLAADLLADDLCPHKVLSQDTQSHLLQNEIDFFPFLHRSEGFDLEFLQDFRGLRYGALVLLDSGEHAGDSGPLDLDEYLDGGERREV